MGVVYRARHVLIDRIVALKLIRPDLRGESHLRAWMLREARAANRVDHAHIVEIHDVGETEDGELYLVMEYLVGASLSSEIAKGPMPLARATDILKQAAGEGLVTRAETTTFYLGREKLVVTRNPGLSTWRKSLFAFLSRNARAASDFFGLPPERVLEIGIQLEL